MTSKTEHAAHEYTAGEQSSPPARDARQLDSAIEHVRQALAGLQFGAVSVIVQDGVVVQVERLERKRFRRGKE